MKNCLFLLEFLLFSGMFIPVLQVSGVGQRTMYRNGWRRSLFGLLPFH